MADPNGAPDSGTDGTYSWISDAATANTPLMKLVEGLSNKGASFTITGEMLAPEVEPDDPIMPDVASIFDNLPDDLKEAMGDLGNDEFSSDGNGIDYGTPFQSDSVEPVVIPQVYGVTLPKMVSVREYCKDNPACIDANRGRDVVPAITPLRVQFGDGVIENPDIIKKIYELLHRENESAKQQHQRDWDVTLRGRPENTMTGAGGDQAPNDLFLPPLDITGNPPPPRPPSQLEKLKDRWIDLPPEGFSGGPNDYIDDRTRWTGPNIMFKIKRF